MDIKNLYNWIIIIIFAIIFGQSVITYNKYETLQKEYNELILKKSIIVDSLFNDNLKKSESITSLESKITSLNRKLDSLHNIKNNIIYEKNNFTVSNSISEGSNLLKQNLNEKTFSNNF